MLETAIKNLKAFVYTQSTVALFVVTSQSTEAAFSKMYAYLCVLGEGGRENKREERKGEGALSLPLPLSFSLPRPPLSLSLPGGMEREGEQDKGTHSQEYLKYQLELILLIISPCPGRLSS